MDTHRFVFAARRWVGSALIAAVTLVGSLGFSSVASADPQPVAGHHAFVGHRVARHHRHGGERGHRGFDRRGGEHRGGHGRRVAPSPGPRREPAGREPRP